MLLQLRLQNLATIKELEAEFDSGFSILTGETGAGKSIMIDALLLVLGGRGDTGLVRTGEDRTVVEAVFGLFETEGIRNQLEEAGIPAEDELILRCVIPRKGRQRRSVNGAAVTAEFLRNLGQQLVNIHGQHENQALLQVGTHIEFLDQHGKLVPLRNTVREAHAAYRQALAAQRDLNQRLAARHARIEELTIIREELEELNLQEGEEEVLQQEASRFSNTERLSLLVGQVQALLHDDEGAVLTQLETARRTLSEAERVDPACTAMRDALESTLFQLEDVHQEVARYTSGIEENPERLAWINERLNRIQRFQRKHKLNSGEALRGLLESVVAELEALEHLEEDGQVLAERIAACEAKLKQESEKLSARRKKAARKLDEAVVRELRQLGMEKARFETQLTPRESNRQPACSPSGSDCVEFLLSVNPGQDLRSLAKVASGGELSRIMLALK
ncbi:MAG TPA: DNA repair protein RecN, partial [Deltaproteobacteria bacterium]|nr:DNA repair protein RecN [Deltaproteobacteria bacterium]